MPIGELKIGRVENDEDQRRALQQIVAKLNEVVRAVNELLASA